MKILEPNTYLKSTNHLDIQEKSSKHLSVLTSNYMITYASKPIQILPFKCVRMCVDIIQVNIYACVEAIIKVTLKACRHGGI